MLAKSGQTQEVGACKSQMRVLEFESGGCLWIRVLYYSDLDGLVARHLLKIIPLKTHKVNRGFLCLQIHAIRAIRAKNQPKVSTTKGTICADIHRAIKITALKVSLASIGAEGQGKQ